MFDQIHASMAQAGAVRDTNHKVIGGVCSGLARRFGTDIMAMRLVVLIAMFVLPGSPVLLYPLAWVLMPDEQRAAQVLGTAPAGTSAPTGTTAHVGTEAPRST